MDGEGVGISVLSAICRLPLVPGFICSEPLLCFKSLNLYICVQEKGNNTFVSSDYTEKNLDRLFNLYGLI